MYESQAPRSPIVGYLPSDLHEYVERHNISFSNDLDHYRRLELSDTVQKNVETFHNRCKDVRSRVTNLSDEAFYLLAISKTVSSSDP